MGHLSRKKGRTNLLGGTFSLSLYLSKEFKTKSVVVTHSPRLFCTTRRKFIHASENPLTTDTRCVPSSPGSNDLHSVSVCRCDDAQQGRGQQRLLSSLPLLLSPPLVDKSSRPARIHGSSLPGLYSWATIEPANGRAGFAIASRLDLASDSTRAELGRV